MVLPSMTRAARATAATPPLSLLSRQKDRIRLRGSIDSADAHLSWAPAAATAKTSASPHRKHARPDDNDPLTATDSMAVGMGMGAGMELVEAPVTFKAYLMCAFAAFAGMLFGYDSGYISGVLGMAEFKVWYGHPVPLAVDPTGFAYHTWQKSLIVSILSAGTFFGALVSGALADWCGRRTTIIAGCAVFIVGVVVQIAAPSIPALVVGRLVGGFGVGFVSAINILYMSEVAPRKVRGAIVSSYQFAITVGIMLASCATFATQARRDSGAFRIPIAIQFLWAIVLATGLALLPESPRYHVKKGRLDLAIHALGRLRGQPPESDALQDELAEIQANYEYELQVGEVSWLGCFTGGLHNRHSNASKVFIGTAIQMFQQFTGINFIIYYNTTFFQQVHLKNPFLVSMITTIVNVCSTPVSFYTIERYGRRPLLIWGAFAMTVCEFIVAIVWTVDAQSTAANYCLIVFVCLYVFFYASTWGPAAWVVVGEIFQLPIRAKGVALSTASNWLWNCVIGIITPYMVDPDAGNLGGKVFFVWGCTCAICTIFAYLFVPETKGLTLEQVDTMLEEVSARRSARWHAPTSSSSSFFPPNSRSGPNPTVSGPGSGPGSMPNTTFFSQTNPAIPDTKAAETYEHEISPAATAAGRMMAKVSKHDGGARQDTGSEDMTRYGKF